MTTMMILCPKKMESSRNKKVTKNFLSMMAMLMHLRKMKLQKQRVKIL